MTTSTVAPASPALYLRVHGPERLDEALTAGADGISYEVELVRDGIAAVGGAPLEESVAAALERGLRVELVAGALLDSRPATPVVAAAVAALVSARQISDAVRLTSFDHAAVASIGRSAEGLAIGLRHVSTLHRGVEYAHRLGVASIHPLIGSVSREEVGRARAAGLASHAWTLVMDTWPLDEREQLAQVDRAGFDAVTLGDPDLLVARRAER